MPYQLRKNFKLFSLNSNPELAQEIADILGCGLGKNSITHFSDGEIQTTVVKSSEEIHEIFNVCRVIKLIPIHYIPSFLAA